MAFRLYDFDGDFYEFASGGECVQVAENGVEYFRGETLGLYDCIAFVYENCTNEDVEFGPAGATFSGPNLSVLCPCGDN